MMLALDIAQIIVIAHVVEVAKEVPKDMCDKTIQLAFVRKTIIFLL